MGGSSSKTVKTKYEVRHTVEGQLVATNISKKGSIKKKNKNSVKIKDKKDHKQSKSGKSQQMHGASLSVIEEVSGSATEAALTSSPAYRKKSSCPSCEARDILLGKNRSRSGSEKSLRFSDFTKVLRRTRVYDWELEPINIPLDAVEEPIPDDICYVCEVYTGSHVRACRVCLRAYHDSCLTKIGHPLSNSSRNLTAAYRWTCHQCASLNYLLTQEEVRIILNELDDLDIPKDHITEASYVSYCRHYLGRNNVVVTAEEEKKMVQRFRSVASDKPGVISLTQLLNMETVRVLSQRCKDSLVHLLTKAEVAEARKMFQTQDSGRTCLSPSTAAGDSTSRLQQWYSEADCLENSIKFIDEHLDSSVTWPAFLREIALDLISQRSNPRTTLSPDSGPDDTQEATLTFSSCASLDVDEDRYSTCTSELEPPLLPADLEFSASQHGQSETNLPADQGGNTTAKQDNIHTHHPNRRPAETDVGNNPTLDSTSAGSPPDVQMTGRSIAQLPSHLPPRALEQAGLQTGNQWANTGMKISAETPRCSSYNDSPHIPIPWEDQEKISNRKGGGSDSTKAAYRKSEVIHRQAVTTCGQSRAASQSDSTYMQAPVGVQLTDTVQRWKH